MKIVKLKPEGTHRVLNAQAGLTFMVDSEQGDVIHVRDYRYAQTRDGYCIWTLRADQCEVVEAAHAEA